MTRRRLSKRLVVVIFVLGLVFGVTPAMATQLERFSIPGLRQPVQLVVDRWGVPHMYAESVADAFLAQGFNAARERLFQIDLWRRRGLGKLSEVLGPSYVEQDRAARLFLYRGDMRREWDSYGPNAELAASRFTQGINAYVDWLGRHPEAMPEEFRILGYTPDHWEATDIVRIRSHGLTRNLTSEVARSKVACVAGLPADLVRVSLKPKRETVVPVGFDPCALPSDVLRVFQLATQEVTFANGQVRALPSQPDEALEGSNNWVVAPKRTATGRPILANDPHRVYSAPSLRYISQLVAPGMNVIGANEPFLPGISIGHNGTIAFGLTVMPMDQEDLYVYQLDPNDHSRYRYGDGWERLRTSTEKVSVAGEPARQVELSYTRHGPVIAVDGTRAYAVRTAWLQPGMSPYYGSQKYMTAKNFTQFTDAMRDWGAPTENQVYADVHGNIGWVPGGLAPIRRGYDGLMPIPGDGRYEWDGFYNGDILPRSYNPTEGFIATANEFNLPPNYPYPLGFEWTYPARHQRIVETLAKSQRGTVADSMRLQGDQVSLVARRLVRQQHSVMPVDMCGVVAGSGCDGRGFGGVGAR
ncbi:penicillin acylase family protein [Kibdelosporangium philippinense]|uniref:Penicillin acylase family protein n=1 Tax=Kibdelosporangium philippinense TaxID=211113 RepID=A0ABS8ZBS6_9PSEU|nr:penicillin acylase family protein [Kibdelosporangium philippinense]MCE7004285.1 penicillin acylase family protein [Kibdelosporangium philippinense]